MFFKPFTIGKYDFLEEVSSGGMGRVFKARMRGAGQFYKVVAIKQLLNGIPEASNHNQRFEREAVISVQLAHPNIVQTLDYFTHDGQAYLVMEFMEGYTLRDLFSEALKLSGKERIQFACYVISEVADALYYAYKFKNAEGNALEIVHRDVTPHNMMVNFSGEVKIIDFGVAKANQVDILTASGQIIGKSGYFAPELFEGVEGSHLSDLYSLGVVFHELLTGNKLFSGPNELVVLKKQSEMVIPIPSTDNREITAQIDQIVLKLLNPDPRKRFENSGRLSQSLKKVLSEEFPGFSKRDFIAIFRKLVPESKKFELSKENVLPPIEAIRNPPDLPVLKDPIPIFRDLDLERFYQTKSVKRARPSFLIAAVIVLLLFVYGGRFIENKSTKDDLTVEQRPQQHVSGTREVASSVTKNLPSNRMKTQVNVFMEKRFLGVLNIAWELNGESSGGGTKLECGRKQTGVCDPLEFEHSGKNQIGIRIKLPPEFESVYRIESCKVVGGTDQVLGSSCELLVTPSQYVEAWIKIVAK